MFFTVLPVGGRPPASAPTRAFLVSDNWDDWFEFSTLFNLLFVNAEGEPQNIGGVKIAQFGMTKGQRSADVPQTFDALDQTFFSIGQDDSYYEKLNGLGPTIRDKILAGLQDLAFYPTLFDQALNERVTGISLLRSVTQSSVRGQFQRMARGGVRLSPYSFLYAAPPNPKGHPAPVSLSFAVVPESQPPTNIHVLIGRNGVGKTHLLNFMTRAIVEEDSPASEVGKFASREDVDASPFANLFGSGEDVDANPFANLVSVTFSAFDTFEPLPVRRDKSTGVLYSYIGLKRTGKTDEGKTRAPKSPASLSREFSDSVRICRQGARAGRWRRALEMLEADPIFKDADVAELADDSDDEQLKTHALSLFNKLSSGHKVVLLTITRLVETVEERTLVLIDEPEAHLHPPLLSAFVRALSDLLINRNGVAIIATHSPVVLQEVPKSCAWKIRRTGGEVIAERPAIETFGENVGVLTREVFGLEVTHSGFHKLLRDTVKEDADFDAVVERFGGELGTEAKAIVRALIAALANDTL